MLKRFLEWVRRDSRERAVLRVINDVAGIAYDDAPQYQRLRDLRELREYIQAHEDGIRQNRIGY